MAWLLALLLLMGRPAAQREPARVATALKLLPGILSSVTALAKAWEALEPLIKAHFQ